MACQCGESSTWSCTYSPPTSARARLSPSVADCRNVTFVEVFGLAKGTGVLVAVALPLKYPVLRKFSVRCRESSAPTSTV